MESSASNKEISFIRESFLYDVFASRIVLVLGLFVFLTSIINRRLNNLRIWTGVQFLTDIAVKVHWVMAIGSIAKSGLNNITRVNIIPHIDFMISHALIGLGIIIVSL
jgi:hypothetical protein